MSESRTDLPGPKAPNFEQRVRETLMTYLGRQGNALDRGLTLRDLIENGIIKLGASWRPGGGVPPLEPGDAVAPSEEPDLTPPPTPTGFVVSAAISHVFIEHDNPVYTQGRGHLRTRVYGATVTTGSPLPTFGDAIEVGQFTGSFWALPSNPGTTWRLWIKWETIDNVLSVSPSGGTNGLEAITGQDVSAMVKAMTGPGNPFTILPSDVTIDGVVYPAGTYSVRSFIIDGQITNAKIQNAAIDDAKIANLSASKIKAGSIDTGEYIQSASYMPGSQGWRINGDGTAEFQNAVVRGTVYATNGQFWGTLLGGAATSYSSGLGFYAGGGTTSDGSAYRWRVGSPAGARIQWTGESVEIYDTANQLTFASGAINPKIGLALRDTAWAREVLVGGVPTIEYGAVLAAASNGTTLCVVGEGGRVATSQNGATWLYQSGLQGTLWGDVDAARAIAWNGSVFCVGGIDGKIATSPDGITWTYRTTLRSTTWGTAADVRAIVWNGTVFCAVGESGRVATSPDGVTWTYRSSLSATAWGATAANALAWTGSQFCVVGDAGRVATSPDGITWTNRTGLRSTTWGTAAAALAIAWNGSAFCVVGDGGRVATSLDGSTWTFQAGLQATAWGTTASVNAVAWNGQAFCVGGASGQVATSPDGVTWTNRLGLSITQWGTNTVNALLPGPSKVSAFGGAGFVASSPDGATWTYWIGLGAFSTLNKINAGNISTFIADAAVNTLTIAGNAVTQAQSVYAGLQQEISSTSFQTVVSMTVTVTGTQPILVWASCSTAGARLGTSTDYDQFFDGNYWKINAQDADAIFQFSIGSTDSGTILYNTVIAGKTISAAPAYVFVGIPAGTYTLRLQVAKVSSAQNNFGVRTASLSFLETKR